VRPLGRNAADNQRQASILLLYSLPVRP